MVRPFAHGTSSAFHRCRKLWRSALLDPAPDPRRARLSTFPYVSPRDQRTRTMQTVRGARFAWCAFLRNADRGAPLGQKSAYSILDRVSLLSWSSSPARCWKPRRRWMGIGAQPASVVLSLQLSTQAARCRSSGITPSRSLLRYRLAETRFPVRVVTRPVGAKYSYGLASRE